MHAALLLPVLLAQAIVAPTAPNPASLTGWVALPLQKSEYRRYGRTDSNGLPSVISASKQICTCQPKTFVSELKSAFEQFKYATVVVHSLDVCGEPAKQIIATGLAGTSGRKNTDAIAFRKNGTFYVLDYVFQSAAPEPDAQAALMTLCTRHS